MIDYRTFTGFLTDPPYGGPLYNVFLPKVVTQGGREVDDVSALYAQLHQHQSGAQSLSHVPCTVVGPSHAAFETLQLTFSVTCAAATKLALPISYNPYSTVFVKGSGPHLDPIAYFHVRSDPRVIINITTSGHETVVVHLPTLWGSLF